MGKMSSMVLRNQDCGDLFIFKKREEFLKKKIYKNVGMFGYFWKKNKKKNKFILYVDMYFGTGERLVIPAGGFTWELTPDGILFFHRCKWCHAWKRRD